MAKKGKKNSAGRRGEWAPGLILSIMALASLLSLISWGNEKNYLGPVGDYLSRGITGSLGLSSYFAPFAFGALSLALFRRKWFKPILRTILGLILMLVFLNTLFTLMDIPDPLFNTDPPGGGRLGLFISVPMVGFLGRVGSYIVAVAFLIVSYSIVARKPQHAVPLAAGKGAWRLIRLISTLIAWVIGLVAGLIRQRMRVRAEKTEKEKTALIKDLEIVSYDTQGEADDSEAPLIIRDRAIIDDHQIPLDMEPEPPSAPPRARAEGYKLPPLSLLEQPERSVSSEREENLKERSRVLEKKLADFGVEGRVKKVMPGPVVTMYEFEPAAGVKVNKIVNLSDDLALGLRALSVRIVAPLPGKAVVGIELPNKNRESVYLKEIIMSQKFQNSKAKLVLGLGKSILGEAVVTDLAQIPHLLIAGATGSGKSVCLNSMICSILYKSTPNEVKLILIDPKRLELSVYADIPHLITPVVIDPRKASTALHWAVGEMERRYTLLSERGVRNIEGFNSSIDAEMGGSKSSAPSGEEDGLKKLPYIVIVIDELADLMMVSSRDVEESLTRLAQMARAAGIHLLVATQRPSVDVLTGIIKVNFPSRMSFQLFSKVDSRTILDTGGAERLLGKGDMLFLPPGTSRLERIHGPFVSENEIKRLVDFWKNQQTPEYDDDVLRPMMDDEEIGDEEYDEKYQEAIALVARTGQASISMVQRRLRVGYNRSARMIELMEREGLVGPSDGSKPREVFVRESDIDRF